jgi:hypothetical protein
LRSMNPLLNLSVRCGKDLKNLRQKRRSSCNHFVEDIKRVRHRL